MAGEPADGSVVPEDGDATESRGVTESISELRGLIFRYITLGATVFGITMVTVMILYVLRDALGLAEAEPAWFLVYFCTLVAPSVALVGYFRWSNPAAGEVASATTAIPIAGLVCASALVILNEEVITAQEWLTIVVALLTAAGLILAHKRRREQQALERLFVLIGAPLLTMFGVPPISIDRTIATPFMGTELFTISFSTPELLPSVRELVFLIPVFPLDWMLLTVTVAAPAGLVFGHFAASRREDSRLRVAFPLLAVGLAAGAAVAAPLANLSSTTGVILATALFLPVAAYAERLLERDEGLVGVSFPVVLVGGALLGAYIVSTFGISAPEPWLNYGFLTNAASRTPEDAGFYPPLVGSILIVVVIALSAFPVGVGAAIYLEEYAPDTGWTGRFVEFLEINIGNLAGVPSIVYGLLGLALFVNGIGLRDGIVIVAGLTIGLLILPIVIISSQEALRSVPDSRRRASYGMGATRWQTIRNVVLPEAMPGILTGTILAMGRAIGETAPLIMIGVADVVRLSPGGFFDIAAAMPAQIFSWKSEIDPAFREGVMAAGVITLLAVLLIMNATAIILRNKYQRDS